LVLKRNKHSIFSPKKLHNTVENHPQTTQTPFLIPRLVKTKHKTMRKIASLSICIGLSLLGLNSCTKTATTTSAVDTQVHELLSNMTVEEKAGQMTQIDIRNLLNNGYGNTDQKLNKEKLREAVQTYKVGSLLNCIEAYSPQKWHELITEIQKEAQQTPNKIPVIYGTDAVHGVGFMTNATLFPHNISLAATRNDSLVKRASAITALEARAVGFTWNFAPVLDLGREAYWSRLEETFGEDVHLTCMMGSAAIKGMEESGLDGDKALSSCMKHFIGYSAPKNGIDRTPAHLPEIILREYYLTPFREAVESGASTLMINSGEINGVPTHGNKWLLTDILRGELKFEGVACSDWEDIIRLHTWQKVASSPKEAVEIAVNAGVDMSMVPNDYSFTKYVIELVNEGKITQKRLDEAVGRILKLKIKLGLFKNPFPNAALQAGIGTEESAQVSLNAARESITLLENKNVILPLKANPKVLITGPTANNITALNSSWSYTWQGADQEKYPKDLQTILSALATKIGSQNVISKTSTDFNSPDNYDKGFITQNANQADVILLCLGEPAYAEQPGVINELALPENQRELIKAAKSSGKPVIICLVEGRPRLFPEEAPLADAILMAYRPSNYGAQAIVETLFGDNNPSGKLPITYPKYNGKLTNYDYKFKETEQQAIPGESTFDALDIQWAFGHGLSYTQFEYSKLSVSSQTLTKDASITVSVEVKNTGSVDGKICIELYSRDHYASITPSQKRLRKYQKINLKAGESRTIQFEINASDLAFVNNDMQTVTENGLFDLMIDNQKVEINYKAE
jgi:beta-glucosidase